MSLEEIVYHEQRNRFADALAKINAEHDEDDGSDYDAEVARVARIALVERQRRIDTTKPELLPYDEFLDSPYWIGLSIWLKGRADYRCQHCRRRPYPIGKGLEVHHKTYAHRGFEDPDHLDDLIVLCRTCHKRQHFPQEGGDEEAYY